METRILKISPSDVKFVPMDSQGHPFEDPVLTIEGPSASRIDEAAQILLSENVVAFPTETVYGLGANALSSQAVSKIYKAKNRPPDNPLILHVASLKALRSLMGDQEIPRIYEPLIATFWPGPLTLLLPLDRQKTKISELCTSGQDTFAVRMPEHPLALALLHHSGLCLAAPSANTSTRPSPTTAQHVHHDLKGRISLVLDGGPCTVGLESTVVDGLVSPPQILRPGGISIEQLKRIPGWENTVVHRPGVVSSTEVPRTPGMKYRHYSPTARIILFESTASPPNAKFIADHGLQESRVVLCRTVAWPPSLADTLGSQVMDESMGETGDTIARRLFALLRELDGRGVQVILIEGISENDEGLAVMNRLRKAASVVIS